MSTFLSKLKKISLETFDLLVFLVLVLGIILFVRFFIGTPYTVVGYSMMPTFEQGDRIIVEKITQRFGTLQRGDVIVFVPPGREIPFIKRIIGLPGETVKFVDNQTYICNSETATSNIQASNGDYCYHLDEPYLKENAQTIPQPGRDEFKMDFSIITPYYLSRYNQSGLMNRDIKVSNVRNIKTITIEKNSFRYNICNNGDLIFLSEGDQADQGEITLHYIANPETKKNQITEIMKSSPFMS